MKHAHDLRPAAQMIARAYPQRPCQGDCSRALCPAHECPERREVAEAWPSVPPPEPEWTPVRVRIVRPAPRKSEPYEWALPLAVVCLGVAFGLLAVWTQITGGR